MEKITGHLDALERKITKSNKIVAKGDKMSVRDAIKLGQKGNSIVSTVKKTNKDYESWNPTEAESKTVLDRMTKILELSEEHLALLVANKSRFESLKIGGLVKRTIAKTSEVSAEQERIMMSKTPADLKPEAEQLSTRRKAAFDKATAAFSQSVGGEDQAGEKEDDSD